MTVRFLPPPEERFCRVLYCMYPSVCCQPRCLPSIITCCLYCIDFRLLPLSLSLSPSRHSNTNALQTAESSALFLCYGICVPRYVLRATTLVALVFLVSFVISDICCIRTGTQCTALGTRCLAFVVAQCTAISGDLPSRRGGASERSEVVHV